MMSGVQWLAEVDRRVRARMPDVEVSLPDEDLTTFMLGRRGVVLHAVGQQAMLAPSVSTGTTIADRLEHRVQQFDAMAFTISEETIAKGADAVCAHLQQNEITATKLN